MWACLFGLQCQLCFVLIYLIVKTSILCLGRIVTLDVEGCDGPNVMLPWIVTNVLALTFSSCSKASRL